MSLTPEAASDLLARAWQLQREGRLPQAESLCREVLQAVPDWVDALSLFGTVCLKQGKLAEAETAYRQVLQRQPDHLLALNNLGVALGCEGRRAEAAEYHRKALPLQPHDAAAYNNLGTTLRQLGRVREATALFQEAIRLEPDYADAHANLAQALYEQLRLEEAAASIRQALRLRPDLVAGHDGLAAILHAQGKLDEARTHYEEALRLRPDGRTRLVLRTMLPAVYASGEELTRCRQELVNNLSLLHQEGVRVNLDADLPAPLFYLAYQGGDNRDIQESFARLHVAPVQAPELNGAREGSRIRVGFLSRFFREHTIGELMGCLMAY